MEIGKTGILTKVFGTQEVEIFAKLSGDTNPIHLSEEQAEKSTFKRRVVHGFLVSSLISAVIETVMPGEGTIYLEQNMKFKKPVYLNDQVTAKVMVREIINEDKGIFGLNTIVYNQNEEVVIDGDAVVKV